MVGKERQTHLDMARMDRYVCVSVSSKMCVLEYLSVYSMCVWRGVQERLGFGARQRNRPRLDLAKSSNKQPHEFLFSPVFPLIANTHLWCGSEGEPPYTGISVPAAMHVGRCACIFA